MDVIINNFTKHDKIGQTKQENNKLINATTPSVLLLVKNHILAREMLFSHFCQKSDFAIQVYKLNASYQQ